MRHPTFLKTTVAAVSLCQWLALRDATGQVSNRGDLFPSDGVTNTIEYQRFRWLFNQRATSEGIIADEARLKALEIIKRELMKRQRRAAQIPSSSRFGTLQGDHWISIGPAPILNGQTLPPSPVSGRIAAVAIDPTNPNHWLIGAAQG